MANKQQEGRLGASADRAAGAGAPEPVSASRPVGSIPDAGRIADILDKAADLIEPEGAWTQEAFSRNADGSVDLGYYEDEPLAASNPVCWCALGAIAKASGSSPLAPNAFGPKKATLSAEAARFLEAVLGQCAENWNDAPERTQAEVVAKLREAAAKARGETA